MWWRWGRKRNFPWEVGLSPPPVKNSCKLQKLKLPKFSGNSTDWPGIQDQFKTFIHSIDGLSDIDRFSYLKKYLCGSATLHSQSYKEKASLPDNLILLISRKFEGNAWTLDRLLKFISDELISKANCVSISILKLNLIQMTTVKDVTNTLRTVYWMIAESFVWKRLSFPVRKCLMEVMYL